MPGRQAVSRTGGRLFVREPQASTSTPGAELDRRALTRHIERTDAHARDILTRFEGLATEAGVAFNGLHARTDDLDRAIVDPAESSGCDMIIMLTHGRGVFGELLFGSHTKQVLAPCKLPLLVLH
jgi:nucleotide-binding universal stress UspA family protein